MHGKRVAWAESRLREKWMNKGRWRLRSEDRQDVEHEVPLVLRG